MGDFWGVRIIGGLDVGILKNYRDARPMTVNLFKFYTISLKTNVGH
jgi:hypothetical protein